MFAICLQTYKKIANKLKKGNKIFYACKYDCGLFTIDRIAKGFGGSVACFESLAELQEYAEANGYKII